LSSDLRDLSVPPVLDHKAHSSPPGFFYTADLFVSVKASRRCCCLRGLAPVPGTFCSVPSGLLGKGHRFGWAAKACGLEGGVSVLTWVVSLWWESIARAGLGSYTRNLTTSKWRIAHASRECPGINPPRDRERVGGCALGLTLGWIKCLSR